MGDMVVMDMGIVDAAVAVDAVITAEDIGMTKRTGESLLCERRKKTWRSIGVN
jgi:hypothetical protein